MFISTDNTIFGSSSTVKSAIKRTKELGYAQAILCDDKMFGFLEFYYTCKKEELKPILSLRVVVDGVKVILISKSFNGYKSLSALSKYEDLTWETIKNNMKDLIMVFEPSNANLEACLNLRDNLANVIDMYFGVAKTYTTEDEILKIQGTILGLKEIPVEISTHNTLDDYRTSIAIKAIGEKSTYDKAMNENFVSKENFIKDKDYYSENFSREQLMNLKSIIDSCIDDYVFGDPTPPSFKFAPQVAEEEGLTKEITDAELFTHLSIKGLNKRLELIDESKHDEYRERLKYEINIINKMKFPGYMLIVWDFVAAAKKMNIPVGPGRGSAAGSLVAYSLEITDIDPMPYGLLFERFLNPERVSMPDIDMDFCQTRRGEIIDYVIKKYGKENVAQIITFGKIGGRSSIKDSGRIYSNPAAERMAKAIPETPGIKLSEAYNQNKNELDEIINSSLVSKRTWKYANKLEGLNRQLGVHAAGLVISDNDITNKCPIASVKGTQVVQFDGKYLEDVDLIKFDFLGLKTLSVIDHCIAMVKKNKNIDIDFRVMKSFDDKKVYDYISTGKTGGMFQIESSGMQDLCKRLKPDCFEDLVAILALYRPGPMESGMLDDFIDRKQGRAEISYFFKDMEETLEPILKPTYGVIVYQEQVMQIVQEIGGFSLGEADIIRRAMGKKQIEYMNQKAEEFSQRAHDKKGFKKEEAKELFGLIEKFAGYGFNKSHSAAYALVTYYTAYLKTYHPVEFMASLMNFEYANHDKLITIINTAKSMGIEIKSPNVNTSTELFSVKDGKIVYGLKAIKSAGVNVTSIIKKREKDGEYKSFKDFIERSKGKTPKLGKSAFEGLYKTGALDLFMNRSAAYEIADEVNSIKTSKNLEKFLEACPEGFIEGKKSVDVHTFVLDEKELLGHIYTSPFEDIQKDLDKFNIPSDDDFIVGSNNTIFWFESFEELISKKGKKYAVATLIDISNVTHEVLIFDRGLDSIKKEGVKIGDIAIFDFSLKEDGKIFINGSTQYSRNQLLKSFPMKQKSINIELNDFNSLCDIENIDLNTKIIVTKNQQTVAEIVK